MVHYGLLVYNNPICHYEKLCASYETEVEPDIYKRSIVSFLFMILTISYRDVLVGTQEKRNILRPYRYLFA